jgi:hypothetical protein
MFSMIMFIQANRTAGYTSIGQSLSLWHERLSLLATLKLSLLLTPGVTSLPGKTHATRGLCRVVTLPLQLLQGVRIDGPVLRDDRTSRVGQALLHGEHRVVELLANLELSPSVVEVVVSFGGQVHDYVVPGVEGVAEEDGFLEVLGRDASLVAPEPGDQLLAVGVGAVAFVDGDELDGVVEALDGFGGGVGGERAVGGRGNLGPGGGEGRRAGIVAGASVVLAHDVPSVVPFGVGHESGAQDADVARGLRALSGGRGGRHLLSD